MKRLIPLMLTWLLASPAFAENAPYAGQDARDIKALAPEHVDGLLSGAGLGYAKAAELNGWPGPLHVLELADALALSSEQHAEITTIREAMLTKAMPLGEALVAAEAALDVLFAEGTPDAAAVAEGTAEISAIEAELRAVHLAAHLEVKPLLSQHQQMVYAKQRGYGQNHEGHGQHGQH